MWLIRVKTENNEKLNYKTLVYVHNIIPYFRFYTTLYCSIGKLNEIYVSCVQLDAIIRSGRLCLLWLVTISFFFVYSGWNLSLFWWCENVATCIFFIFFFSSKLNCFLFEAVIRSTAEFVKFLSFFYLLSSFSWRPQ